MTPGVYPASRRRQLHIPRFRPKWAKTRSFRCSSFSHRTRFAGLRREPYIVLRRSLETGPNPPKQPWVVSVPAALGKIAHSGSHGQTGRELRAHPVLAFEGANLAAELFLVTLRLVHTLPHHLMWGFPFMRCGLRWEAQAAAECSSGYSPEATCRFSHTARS